MLAPSLAALVTGAPVYLVLVAGIVLALVRWSEHPSVSMLALAGLGLVLVSSVLGTMLGTSLPVLMLDEGASTSEIGATMGTLGLVRSLFAAAGWGLILGAIFSGRRPSPRPHPTR